MNHSIMLKKLKYDGYQRGVASIVYTFFNKKASGGGATLEDKFVVKNENISNKVLTEELCKPIIRNFEKRKVLSSFTDNILGDDFADMQLISKFNKGINFFLCY